MGKIRYLFSVISCVVILMGIGQLYGQIPTDASRQMLADFGNKKFSHGDSLLRQNDVVNALLSFNEALDLYEMVYGQYDVRLGRVYKVLARVLANKAYHSDAVPYAEKALLITQAQKKINQKSLASLYLMLGKIHRFQAMNNTALPYFLKALDIYSSNEGMLPTDEMVLLHILVGNIYFDQQKYVMSARYLELAGNFILPETGELNQNIANLYERIAQSYMESDSTQLALKYLRKSSDIKEKIYGKNSQELAFAYSSIAAVHFRTRQYDSATIASEKVVEIYLTLPDKKEELIQHKQFLGRQYFLARAYTTSAKWYKDYIKMKKGFITGDSVEQQKLALEYLDIANTFTRELIYHYALEFYEDALTYFQIAFKNKPLEIAHLARKLGKHYIDLGNHHKAIEKLGMAAIIFQQDTMQHQELLADVWTDLGVAYGALENYQAANKAWKEVLKSSPKRMNNQKASVFHSLAKNYLALNSIDSAYHYANREYTFYDEVYHSIHIMMPKSSMLMGNILMRANKPKLALVYFENAWQLSPKEFEEKTNLALEANKNLSKLYKELGEENMSALHLEKASRILIVLKNLK